MTDYDTLKGMMAGAALIAIGASIGQGIAYSPNAAYRDVNGDGRKDIVIEKRIGKPDVYLQQPDGTYLDINKVKELRQAELEHIIEKTQNEAKR